MNEFMKLAILEAKDGISNFHGGPFGAVIVKNGNVVGKGHNEVIKNQNPTCHGEMMAINDACKNIKSFDLSDCEIYTTGYPCPMCMGAIMWANIKKVYYGCDLVDAEDIGFRDLKFYNELSENNDFLVELDKAECKEVFNQYKKLEHDNY